MASLNVQTAGKPENPAIVFLHAFPLSAEMWQAQIAKFSPKFYCIAPDLPGFGESDLPDHAFTFEYYADVVIDHLKKSKIEKAVWCGLSLGGYLALRMYEREPAMCRALVLCDTKSAADGNEAKLKRYATIQTLKKSREEFEAAQWKALTGVAARASAEFQKLFKKLNATATTEGIAAGLVALASRTDTTESLEKIDVPTLIMVGADDAVTPPTDAEALAKAIKGSQITIIPGAGHLSNLEEPKAFNTRLGEFLAGLTH